MFCIPAVRLTSLLGFFGRRDSVGFPLNCGRGVLWYRDLGSSRFGLLSLLPKYSSSKIFERTSASRSRMDAQANADLERSNHMHTNRLIHEQSPYLLQHAHNPVDWYPWSAEAFEKAVREDKPVFLSVGYSTCHWCHVMEVESFEDDEIAQLMNQWFINIKVDREERPDIDKVYMTYVQASQGGGGWPMSVFLTPDLKPIVGGTYFSPDDKLGKPGFKTVLRRVKDVWASKKDALREAGDQVLQQLAEVTSLTASASEPQEGMAQQAVQLCTNQLAKGFDSKLGGFGGPPKFPRPVEIAVIYKRWKRLEQSGRDSSASKILDMALFSLRCMAKGGIHDHIGGGFHRYSVDEYWHVPHFEKMLYDQGQLANVYLDAFAITKDVYYATQARDILDYIRRQMTHPEGGIFSAEDADSAEKSGDLRKKEGAFYVWTYEEVEEVLGDERAGVFATHYYLKPDGNCNLSRLSDPHNEFVGKNVLIERRTLAETASNYGLSVVDMSVLLGQCRERLYASRQKRPTPGLDDKVIVSWNGMVISALARASRVLAMEPPNMRHYFPVTGCDPREYFFAAEGVASFIRAKLFNETSKKLRRSYRLTPSTAPGFLDDYACLIAGLLDLYESGGDTKWLDWAMDLQTSQDDEFMDKSGGAYYSVGVEDPYIVFRTKEDYDGAEPSGNSVAALNLQRLAGFLVGEKSEQYRRTAEHLLAVFEPKVKEVAMAVPLMCCAFDISGMAKREIVIAGVKGAPDTEALITTASASYDPDRIIMHIDETSDSDQEFWRVHNPRALAMAKRSREGKALAYVCQNFTCLAPVSDPRSLDQLLKSTSPSTRTTFKLG